MSELKDKILINIHKGMENNMLSNDDLVQFIECTHKPSMSYMDYIRLLASNPIAKAIKLADLEHNSKITRLKGLRKKLLQKCISEELVNKHNSFLFFLFNHY